MLNAIKVKDGVVKFEPQAPLMWLRRALGGVTDAELRALSRREVDDLLEEVDGNLIGFVGTDRE